MRTQLASALQTRHISNARPALSKAKFDWENPLRLDTLLTEDEIAISQVAHEYCQEKLYPRVLEGYRTEIFDKTLMREMGELGLLGATIDGYGCSGVSSVAYGLIAREVEKVDSGYRSAMSVQSSLVMHPIDVFGTQEQKDRFLPKLATGELIGCFGLTEPNHGSDPASMETTARPHPTKKGVYLLNGAKNWITNSPIADIAIIWAKLNGEIRGFIVERDNVGNGSFATPAIKNKTALRASITGMVQMDDVEVPEENLFPDIKGLKGPFTCLNSARYGISWGAIGALEEALKLARNYALERKQFNKPLASFQLVQKKLAEALTDAAYGLTNCVQVGRLKDQGLATPEMISMIKRRNCDVALKNART
ncbi:hypothetical protein AWJ20_115 [Sugiyamaella lignohabitans]|uniref:Glutaryl-CoA dehydrogenase n=1 Tax=Sugiyamaella lignohabitans TaxID=796027 RepID=A0A161HK16_9ASCO|nr:uncharacterized protein AWJ20_115 [Sugiyamaella lignohabitans]ANB11888.1 hypothetical protein AWJ20_115 [Sugiyamaella lignohabitans]